MPSALVDCLSYLETFGVVYHNDPLLKVFVSGDVVVIFKVNRSRVVVVMVEEDE